MFFLAVSPFFLFVLLLFAGKLKVLSASLISLVLTAFLAVFYWRMNLSLVFSTFLKGGLIAFDIFLIVFGAILFINLLKKRILSKTCVIILRLFQKI